jgi:hypothetical protein
MIGTLRPSQPFSPVTLTTPRNLPDLAGFISETCARAYISETCARYDDLDAEIVEILRRFTKILRRSRSDLPDSGIFVEFIDLRSFSHENFLIRKNLPQLCIFWLYIVVKAST